MQQVAESKQAEMRACGLGDGRELVLLPSFFELLKHLKNSVSDPCNLLALAPIQLLSDQRIQEG